MLFSEVAFNHWPKNFRTHLKAIPQTRSWTAGRKRVSVKAFQSAPDAQSVDQEVQGGGRSPALNASRCSPPLTYRSLVRVSVRMWGTIPIIPEVWKRWPCFQPMTCKNARSKCMLNVLSIEWNEFWFGGKRHKHIDMWTEIKPSPLVTAKRRGGKKCMMWFGL